MENMAFYRRTLRTSSLVIIALLLAVLVIRQEQVLRNPGEAVRALATIAPPTFAFGLNISSNSNSVIGGFGFANVSLRTNSQRKPKSHIAFLKVHKAASSTVQNILYRFGMVRDLSFVIAFHGHYLSRDKNRYSEIIPSLHKSGNYDILCDHVVFNHQKFKSFMFDDAFYLAIVRDPLKRFISAAYYYRYVYRNPYLGKIKEETFLHDLITNPLKYEPKYRESRTFNHMAFDFGLSVSSIKRVLEMNESTMDSFVSNLMDRFDFVMIVEKFDESLVMLKRYLNWSIKDILYIKQNDFRNVTKNANIVIQNVTAEEEERFKQTNRLDYLIYNKFLKKFNDMAAKEKDLDAEVKEFKRKLSLIEAFCTKDNTRRDALFWETRFDGAFRVNRDDCRQMTTNELTFNDQLRKKQLFALAKSHKKAPNSKRQ